MCKKIRTIIAFTVLVAFIGSSIQSPVYAQMAEDPMPFMPKPGTMVHLSPEYTPAYLKGIVIHPENALKFDFIIYKGDRPLTTAQKKEEYTKLTKYFLASLAIPDDDQWVNLSPYEKDRIIKDDFGKTEMGRDLLAQDYMLKQITASLIYPEDNLGKKFWDRVYSQAQQQFGTTSIPVNTFNKVWILPDNALIYEKGNTAYVLKNHLRVMLEEDYLSLQKHSGIQSAPVNRTHTIASRIVKEIVLPELEREVNEDKNFAALRQVYSGMLLAAWYKRALKESFLGQVYANKAKVKGVDQDPKTNEQIYRQYLRAYKKGVFNFIKEDVDKYTNEIIPRKYFSGGTRAYVDFAQTVKITRSLDSAQTAEVQDGLSDADAATVALQSTTDAARSAPLKNYEPLGLPYYPLEAFEMSIDPNKMSAAHKALNVLTEQKQHKAVVKIEDPSVRMIYEWFNGPAARKLVTDLVLPLINNSMGDNRGYVSAENAKILRAINAFTDSMRVFYHYQEANSEESILYPGVTHVVKGVQGQPKRQVAERLMYVMFFLQIIPALAMLPKEGNFEADNPVREHYLDKLNKIESNMKKAASKLGGALVTVDIVSEDQWKEGEQGLYILKIGEGKYELNFGRLPSWLSVKDEEPRLIAIGGERVKNILGILPEMIAMEINIPLLAGGLNDEQIMEEQRIPAGLTEADLPTNENPDPERLFDALCTRLDLPSIRLLLKDLGKNAEANVKIKRIINDFIATMHIVSKLKVLNQRLAAQRLMNLMFMAQIISNEELMGKVKELDPREAEAQEIEPRLRRLGILLKYTNEAIRVVGKNIAELKDIETVDHTWEQVEGRMSLYIIFTGDGGTSDVILGKLPPWEIAISKSTVNHAILLAVGPKMPDAAMTVKAKYEVTTPLEAAQAFAASMRGQQYAWNEAYKTSPQFFLNKRLEENYKILGSQLAAMDEIRAYLTIVHGFDASKTKGVAIIDLKEGTPQIEQTEKFQAYVTELAKEIVNQDWRLQWDVNWNDPKRLQLLLIQKLNNEMNLPPYIVEAVAQKLKVAPTAGKTRGMNNSLVDIRVGKIELVQDAAMMGIADRQKSRALDTLAINRRDIVKGIIDEILGSPNLTKYEIKYGPSSNKIHISIVPQVPIDLEKIREALVKLQLTANVSQLDAKIMVDFAMTDAGMNVKPAKALTRDLGGIDMNSANLDLQIKRDGRGVPLPLARQDMAQLAHIQGFEPVIIAIRPANQTSLFSQLQTNP